MFKVVAMGGSMGDKPIKPSGEILTKEEFVELVSEITSFYTTMTDQEIEEYNYKVMYNTYRDLGDSHEEVVARLSEV